jgi:hypothetical protein
MRRAGYLIVAVMVATGLVATGLAGCAVAAEPTSQPATDPPVVTPAGLDKVAVGDLRGTLTRDHGLREGPGDCGPRLPAYPSVSPVFDGDRLVLLWADPPVQTAQGLSVGSPVAQVREVHPGAEELTAPADSYRFDGLLVTVDGLGYLFLHDQQQVQKIIVGYEKYARLLFHEDFGTC